MTNDAFTTSPQDLAMRHADIKQRITAVCKAAARNATFVKLLAVSKGQPPEAIRQMAGNGQRLFAENYLQELQRKADELQDCDIEWHFTGHLQSRKIPKIVAICDCIHSVDSLDHAASIARAAASQDRVPFPIFIAVNLGSEPQKSGVFLSEASAFADVLQLRHPQLQICGLMSVPPADWDARDPVIFGKYKSLAQKAQQIGAGELSLGMSHDFEMAIKAGATIVRVGSALFGPRKS